MAGKTHEIAFKIAGQVAGSFSTAFKSAGKAVGDLQAATGDLLRTASNTGALIKQSEATNKARTAYQNATTKMYEMAEVMRKTKQPTDEQKAAFNKLEQEVKETKNSYEQNKQKLNELRTATGLAETNIEKLTASFEKQQAAANKAKGALASYNKTQEKLASVNSKIDNTKSGMASNAGAIAGVIGAGVATVGLPIKEAMAYEDAMADVKKVVDFDSASLKQFNEDIGVMSTQIAMSTPELLKISAAWGATGAKAKDMKQLTEMTAKAAVAMDMSAESAGSMMASWKGGMGLTVDETERLANLTNELSNNYNASASAIGDFLVRAGSAGKVAGMSAENVASLGAALINAGATSEVAATGAKAVFDVLGKGGSMSGAAKDAFAQLGMDPREMQKQMKDKNIGAEKVILQVLEKLSKQDESIQGQILTDAFGSTGKSALAPLLSNIKDYEGAIKIANDETAKTKSLQKEFEARNATTSNALILVKNALSAVARAIGEPLLKPIREFSNSIVAMTPAITKFVQENQNLILKVLKVAAIFGTVVIAANGLMLVLRAIVLPVMYAYKAFLMLKSAFALLKVKMALLNGTMLASPWFWVIAAVVALVAAGVLLYKNFDTVKAKVDALWLAFSNRFPAVSAVVGAAIAILVTAVKGAWVVIKSVGLAIWEVVKAVFSGIAANFTVFMDVLDNLLGFIGNVFTGNWSAAWENIKNIVVGVAKGIANSFITMANVVVGALNGLIKGINGLEIPDWVPVVGGKSINIPTIPTIPHLAKGGVVTESTLANIGEAGPEAVIPLRKLENMVGGGGFTFAPTINVSGGGGNVYSDIKKALNESKADLRREMDRYFADKRRLSYA